MNYSRPFFNVIPILHSDKFIHKFTCFFNELRGNNFTGTRAKLALSAYNVSIFIQFYQSFSISNPQRNDVGVNVDRIRSSLYIFWITISKPNKGIKLGNLCLIVPGGNSQKGADMVSVYEKMDVSLRSCNICLINSVRIPKIVPIDPFNFFISDFDCLFKSCLNKWISLGIVFAFLSKTYCFTECHLSE